MESYKMITYITENGPFVAKLVLSMPFEVRRSEINRDSFNVYVERRECSTGEVVVYSPFFSEERITAKGYQIPLDVYPSDEEGKRQAASRYVTIELDEEALGKRIQGTVLASRYVDSFYRITLLHAIDGDPLKSGLVFEHCDGEVFPQLKGWDTVKYPEGDTRLNYGYFMPAAIGKGTKAPLIVWLHGAGEGGMDPRITISANRIHHLSSRGIQEFFGGAAYILTPQCPTVWMDDGVEQLGKSNQSIYVKQLMECIEGFVSAHEDTIDRNRIYIGGMSNGGFMTMRMILDYPEYFAAAQPSCEVFYSDNITEEMLNSIKNIPIWFVHCKHDELVPPRETSLPTYFRLKEAGAENVHFTYYEYLWDTTGKMKDEYRRTAVGFNHAVWNPVLNNECFTDLDGTAVCVNGEPVSLWEWMANQNR